MIIETINNKDYHVPFFALPDIYAKIYLDMGTKKTEDIINNLQLRVAKIDLANEAPHRSVFPNILEVTEYTSIK